MFSDFTICGLQDIALNIRGYFGTLSSLGGPKNYEDHSRLCLHHRITYHDQCHNAVNLNKNHLDRMVCLNTYLSCLAFFVDFWKVLYVEPFQIPIGRDYSVYSLKILILSIQYCVSNSLYIPYFPEHCQHSRSLASQTPSSQSPLFSF